MGRHQALKSSSHLLTSLPSHYPAPFPFPKSSYALSSALLQTPAISALSVGDRIPGFKTSAAFLSSLQSNIFIELDSGYESADDVQYYMRPSTSTTSPSPLARTMSSSADADTAPPQALNIPTSATEDSQLEPPKESSVGPDGIPLLKTLPADDNDMRAEALHIVADSVAQQRNLASRSLIFHPITLAIFAAAFAFLHRTFYAGDNFDYIKILTTFMGVIMAILGAIRLICGPYIFEAERIGTWRWLDQGRSAQEEEETGIRVLGDSDEILLTKFGDEYIGAIIFRGVHPIASPASPGGNKRTRRAHSPSRRTKMIIRAWSVAQKYRRKEVGSALMEDAIRIGKGKGWTVDGVDFADDHANHKRVLPAMFNGGLDKFDAIARTTLDSKLLELVPNLEKGKRKR